MNASFLLIACSLLVAQAEPNENPAEPVEKPAATEHQPAAPILIDWIHANDFSMVGLRPGIFDYHAQCGFRHGFDFLRSRQVDHEYISEDRLTPERLAAHKLLFINLVSAEREPFLVSEIMAIRDFVKSGGSLLIVTDHSNCYFHSHRLKPLLAVLGIQSFTDTVCDVSPHTIGSGNGWVTISQFRPHPVTKGLSRLAIQTGGRVDPRYAVAWTSDQSWADQWTVGIYGETNDIGLFGDFEREDHEPLGPHGVVLARDFYQGRIVIVGDQNVWSDGVINYADNYRLWLNSMAWLIHDPKLADWKAYEDWHAPRVVLYEPVDTPRFGSSSDSDYFRLSCLLARHYWTFTNDRLDEPADLRIVADGQHPFTPNECSALSDYVRDGGTLIVLPNVPSDSVPLAPEEDTAPRQSIAASIDLSDATRTQTEHTTEYTFENGGRMVLIAADLALHCQQLAPPTRLPNAEEAKRAEAFLRILRRLLGE